MTEFYDALETRDHAAREAAHMAALPAQIAHAQTRAAAMRDALSGIDATAVTSRAALAKLPVTRKAELHARQKTARDAAAAGARQAHR